MAKRIPFLLLLVILLFTAACNQAAEADPGLPDVAALLSDRQYDREVGVFGLVSDLGTMFCPCFILSSGGESLTVWYDLMVLPDGSLLDPVNVEGIENGEVVTVAGWLQEDTGELPGINLYATKIVLGTDSGICDPSEEATPCPED